MMAERNHLFPSRTQQLSSHASKVLGWKRPGRIDCCRSGQSPRTNRAGAFLLILHFCFDVYKSFSMLHVIGLIINPNVFSHYDVFRRIHYNLSTCTEAVTEYPVRKGNGSCKDRSERIHLFFAFLHAIHLT